MTFNQHTMQRFFFGLGKFIHVQESKWIYRGDVPIPSSRVCFYMYMGVRLAFSNMNWIYISITLNSY
jgi:hypothetical protein